MSLAGRQLSHRVAAEYSTGGRLGWQSAAVKQWKISEPNCRVVIFENAGHCVNMDVPREFNETMEDFWTSAE